MNKSEDAQKRRFWIILILIAGMILVVLSTIAHDNDLKRRCLDRSELGVQACDGMGFISKILPSN